MEEKIKTDENAPETEINIQEKQKRLLQQNRQLKFIFIVLIILLILVAIPFISQKYFSKFTYSNMEFEKTKVGKIIFYTTKLPVSDEKLNIYGSYNLQLRNDPRKLNDIKINITDNNITFYRTKPVYISIDPKNPKCEDNLLAVVELTAFLKDFALLNLKGALSKRDPSINDSKDITYANCEINPHNTVLIVQNGTENSIKKSGESCYELTYKDCEINRVGEKFLLLTAEQYSNQYATYFDSEK